MPNMSYCRFENTFNDFRDCLAALKDDGMHAIESRRERDYAEDLMKLAVRYVEVYKQSLASEAQEKQDKLNDLLSDAYSSVV